MNIVNSFLDLSSKTQEESYFEYFIQRMILSVEDYCAKMNKYNIPMMYLSLCADIPFKDLFPYLPTTVFTNPEFYQESYEKQGILSTDLTINDEVLSVLTDALSKYVKENKETSNIGNTMIRFEWAKDLMEEYFNNALFLKENSVIVCIRLALYREVKFNFIN